MQKANPKMFVDAFKTLCTHVVVHVLNVVWSHFAYSHFALQGDVIIVMIECSFITSTGII